MQSVSHRGPNYCSAQTFPCRNKAQGSILSLLWRLFFHGWSAEPVCQLSENLSEVTLCPQRKPLTEDTTNWLHANRRSWWTSDSANKQISCHCGDMSFPLSLCGLWLVCVCVWESVCLLFYSWEFDQYLSLDVLSVEICNMECLCDAILRRSGSWSKMW